MKVKEVNDIIEAVEKVICHFINHSISFVSILFSLLLLSFY